MVCELSCLQAAATDLDELTDTVTSYISFCEDMCVPTRTYLTFNNDKPWFSAKVKQLRQAKEDAYRSGDKALYKQAKYTLNREIRVAKLNYSGKLKNSFQEMTPNQCGTVPQHSHQHPAPPSPLLFLNLPLRSVKSHPASNVPPSSLYPRNQKTQGLNDYRPVALTSVVMKSFERLVLAYLKDITGPLLDPLQFAYRPNRSVDDAVNMGLHYIHQHLDKPGTYARILFVDFSSAFNTIIPDILQIKLSQLSVPTSICPWITSFLTDRQQLVRLGKLTSGTRTISTGAPQGCVLSPLLFSLYTNDCTSKDPSVKRLKFADDTTVIGLIRDGDESADRQEVEQLSLWCSHNNLECNTLKTVEMTVDFRRKPPALPPLTIMNSTVAAVDSFKFLGTNISQDLKWDIHIDSIVKKAQQRLYFLRQLKKFNLPLMTQSLLRCH
ncbi:hypothetical protein M9458_053781 [Cirrhinus mrigala]|uniref:Reverse transcriptase domain-containing protein n=1 Tax=Cirrhinus mrigala TaxID=683832 RepID=A0ABD0MP62_CIRMR